jgi:hypothetical protein
MASLTALLHSSAAHAQIRDAIAAALKRATRVDAAIAFITAAGADFAHRSIDTAHTELRLVTSVRWPTDIRAVATLATRWPGAVSIHLGGYAPQEKGGDRYQMHSKALAVTGPGSWFTGFVGSHNWTFTALEGVNVEATVEVRCDADDRFAADLRAHVDACIGEADPFDPSLVDAYLAIQRALMPGGPRDPDDEDLDDFDRFPAVVMHAEDPEGLAAHPDLHLYAGPEGPIADAFIHGRRVDLYLYPEGGLFRDGRPEPEPTYFAGTITLVNTKADAHVQQRNVDSAILDLAAPRIRSVAAFPDVLSASREVAMRLENQGRRAPFVYHTGTGQKPTVRDRIQFEREPIAGLPGLDRAAARRYLHAPRFGGDQLLRMTPVGIRREVTVSVPSPELYPEHPEIVLKERFDQPLRRFGVHRRDVVEGSLKRDEGRQFIVRHATQKGGPFVFEATHRSKR